MRGGEATQRVNQPITARRETTTLFSGGGGGVGGGGGIQPERMECVGYDVGGEGRHQLRTWHEEDDVAVAAGNNTTIK